MNGAAFHPDNVEHGSPKPSVAEALANRKAGEDPFSLSMTFEPGKTTEEFAMIERAQRQFEIERQIARVKGGAS